MSSNNGKHWQFERNAHMENSSLNKLFRVCDRAITSNNIDRFLITDNINRYLRINYETFNKNIVRARRKNAFPDDTIFVVIESRSIQIILIIIRI